MAGTQPRNGLCQIFVAVDQVGVERLVGLANQLRVHGHEALLQQCPHWRVALRCLYDVHVPFPLDPVRLLLSLGPVKAGKAFRTHLDCMSIAQVEWVSYLMMTSYYDSSREHGEYFRARNTQLFGLPLLSILGSRSKEAGGAVVELDDREVGDISACVQQGLDRLDSAPRLARASAGSDAPVAGGPGSVEEGRPGNRVLDVHLHATACACKTHEKHNSGRGCSESTLLYGLQRRKVGCGCFHSTLVRDKKKKRKFTECGIYSSTYSTAPATQHLSFAIEQQFHHLHVPPACFSKHQVCSRAADGGIVQRRSSPPRAHFVHPCLALEQQLYLCAFYFITRQWACLT